MGDSDDNHQADKSAKPKPRPMSTEARTAIKQSLGFLWNGAIRGAAASIAFAPEAAPVRKVFEDMGAQGKGVLGIFERIARGDKSGGTGGTGDK